MAKKPGEEDNPELVGGGTVLSPGEVSLPLPLGIRGDQGDIQLQEMPARPVTVKLNKKADVKIAVQHGVSSI